MIPTKDEIRDEARRNYNRRNPFGGGIHYVTGEQDFIAGADWVLQKLQQPDVVRSLPLQEDEQDAHQRLADGRHYLMGVRPDDLTVEDALEAFGFGRNGLRQ